MRNLAGTSKNASISLFAWDGQGNMLRFKKDVFWEITMPFFGRLVGDLFGIWLV